MEPFLGKWQVDIGKTTGVEEFGKLFGWDEAKRSMYATTPYTLQINRVGDGLKAFLDYTQFNISIDVVKLGEEVEYLSPDGTKAMLILRIEGGEMLENYRTKEGITWKTVRRIDGDKMVAETTSDNNTSITCFQHLTRI